jgi:hypothetical protein
MYKKKVTAIATKKVLTATVPESLKLDILIPIY